MAAGLAVAFLIPSNGPGNAAPAGTEGPAQVADTTPAKPLTAADRRAIDALRKAAPNLESLSAQHVSNLDLERGVCYIQTDDDCTDSLLKVPQLLAIRPRCSMHGGETVRNLGGK